MSAFKSTGQVLIISYHNKRNFTKPSFIRDIDNNNRQSQIPLPPQGLSEACGQDVFFDISVTEPPRGRPIGGGIHRN